MTIITQTSIGKACYEAYRNSLQCTEPQWSRLPDDEQCAWVAAAFAARQAASGLEHALDQALNEGDGVYRP